MREAFALMAISICLLASPDWGSSYSAEECLDYNCRVEAFVSVSEGVHADEDLARDSSAAVHANRSPDSSDELASLTAAQQFISIELTEVLTTSADEATVLSGNVATSAPPSTEELCEALFQSAKENDLSVASFTNLIWQESRFRFDAVSHAGALGVAQFMPEVAASAGLDDPFDPRKAIPASARLLRDLHKKFGNFGLAAGAYNAGPKRIEDWLASRGSLPRETKLYIRNITGSSAEEWRRGSPQETAIPLTRGLPCAKLPRFAAIEQEQSSNTPATSAVGPQAETDLVPRLRSLRRKLSQPRPASRGERGRFHSRVANNKRERLHTDRQRDVSLKIDSTLDIRALSNGRSATKKVQVARVLGKIRER